MRLVQLTKVKQNKGMSLRTDQAGRPWTCLLPLTKHCKAAKRGTLAGPKNRLLNQFQESELRAPKR